MAYTEKEGKEESKIMHPQDEDPAELSKYIANESSATFSYLKKAENYMKKFYESYLVPNSSNDTSRENSDDESEEDRKKNEGNGKKEKRKRKKKPQTLCSKVKYNITKKLTLPNLVIIGFIACFMMFTYSRIAQHRNQIVSLIIFFVLINFYCIVLNWIIIMLHKNNTLAK